MGDCSTRTWKVPARREDGVVYMHGHDGVDYERARAIVVRGVRFERALPDPDCSGATAPHDCSFTGDFSAPGLVDRALAAHRRLCEEARDAR